MAPRIVFPQTTRSCGRRKHDLVNPSEIFSINLEFVTKETMTLHKHQLFKCVEAKTHNHNISHYPFFSSLSLQRFMPMEFATCGAAPSTGVTPSQAAAEAGCFVVM